MSCTCKDGIPCPIRLALQTGLPGLRRALFGLLADESQIAHERRIVKARKSRTEYYRRYRASWSPEQWEKHRKMVRACKKRARERRRLEREAVERQAAE